jgi:WD40 repeat protein
MKQPIPLLVPGAPTAPSNSPVSPLKDLGTTYSMAQEVRWVDASHFAIGRWDGSLTIFTNPASPGPPSIAAAIVTPSLSGVQMIAWIAPNLFGSSNDGQSITIWGTDGTFSEDGIQVRATLAYDPAVGVANDGTTTERDGVRYFVTGHANGNILIWRVEPDGSLTLLDAMDLRSPNPIPSPYPLKNIRGVESWKPGYVVTGSEDGDICLVDVVNKTVLARMRYNPAAQRGINDIDVCGDYLTVANCSVGPEDRNLWLYGIQDAGFTPLDSVNLKVNTALDQVFNFCVDQALVDDRHYFFATTQEGVVWIGTLQTGKLKPITTQAVSTKFGAALSYQPDGRLLAVAGDNLHLFGLQ